MFFKREPDRTAAEEASHVYEGERIRVKLSGKRTGKRTTF